MPADSDQQRRVSACNITLPRGLLVGRSNDLAAVLTLLESARLVTLFGTAGIGKTRLSLHVGRAYHAAHPERSVLFIDWSVAESLAALYLEAARVLEVRLPVETGDVGVWREELAAALASAGPLLVICDNVEHLIDDGFEVLDHWLDVAPALQILATSRERLRVEGERVYDLPPLSLPCENATRETLEASEAASLFLHRARAVGAAFVDQLSGEDAATLVRDIAIVVRRLDGLPLAIELAAARSSMLTPAQLAMQLPEKLKTLSSGRRGVQARQATLRGAIDWSWDLLSSSERHVFAQCAVFAAPFTLEAGEAVLLEGSALLQSLVDRSLLRSMTASGEIFFYDLLRAYAQEKLQEIPDRVALLRRHARFFARGDQPLSRAEARAALRHAMAHTDDHEWLTWALEIVARLEDAWRREGLSDDEQSLIDALLDATQAHEEIDAAARARAWRARGNLHRLRGRLREARADLERAHRMLFNTGDTRSELLVRTLNDLGIVCHESGSRDDAARCFEEARDVAAALVEAHPTPMAITLLGRLFGSLAIVYQEQDQGAHAHQLYTQALQRFRSCGAQREEGIFLCNLGDLYREEGALEDAKTRYLQALEIVDSLDDQRIRGVLLGNLGGIAQEEGALDEAAALREQAIEILTEVGDDRLAAVFEGYLGATLHLRGEREEALQHYGRALRSLKAASDQRFQAIFSMYRAVARAQLGAPAEAAQRLDALSELVETLNEPHLRSTLDVHRAHVAYLLGEGDPPTAPERTHDELRFALALYATSPSSPPRPASLSPRPASPSPPPSPPLEGEDAWIEVALDGSVISLADGSLIDLRRRRAPRRILARLAQHLQMRSATTIEGLDLDALLEAGWPDEKIHPEAASNRVYVAVATLRSLGLQDVLLTREGYLLNPTRVRVLKNI